MAEHDMKPPIEQANGSPPAEDPEPLSMETKAEESPSPPSPAPLLDAEEEETRDELEITTQKETEEPESEKENCAVEENTVSNDPVSTQSKCDPCTEELWGIPIDQWRDGAQESLEKAKKGQFVSVSQLASPSLRDNRCFTLVVLVSESGPTKIPKHKDLLLHWEVTNLRGNTTSIFLPSPWNGIPFG